MTYKPKKIKPTADENTVKKALKHMLDSLEYCFHFPASAGGFSVGGISDRLGCRNGKFFAIEAKRPGRRGEANEGLSGLQVRFGERVLEAGGRFFRVDDEESIEFARQELLKHDNR